MSDSVNSRKGAEAGRHWYKSELVGRDMDGRGGQYAPHAFKVIHRRRARRRLEHVLRVELLEVEDPDPENVIETDESGLTRAAA